MEGEKIFDEIEGFLISHKIFNISQKDIKNNTFCKHQIIDFLIVCQACENKRRY